MANIKLSDDERKALHNYKAASDGAAGGSLCFDVNERLQSAIWPDELEKDFRDHIAALDRVFSRCQRLLAEQIVFRGVGQRSALGEPRIGRKLRTLSYWSTSTSRSVALGFVKSSFDNSHGALLALRLPTGLPVFDMETLEGTGGNEREFLLPRGLLWEIEECAKGDVAEIPVPARQRCQSLGLLKLRAVSPAARPLI